MNSHQISRKDFEDDDNIMSMILANGAAGLKTKRLDLVFQNGTITYRLTLRGLDIDAVLTADDFDKAIELYNKW